MKRFKFISKNKISQLPKTPGVYVFKNDKELLYIGKAANIRNRVKNHFNQPSYRDNLFLEKVKKIGFIKTDSEIEALLLEAKLIKKYQPKYNIMWRDDKKFFYVGINKKVLQVFITHQPQKKQKTEHMGPFVEGTSLKKTLRVLRKIFPYYTTKKHPKNLCSWCHLGLCPGPKPDLKEYKKNIKNLISFLKGEKKSVLRNLKKEMKETAKLEDFEKAAKIRDQIFSLEKVIANTTVIERPKEINWNNIQKVLQKIIKTKNKPRTTFRKKGRTKRITQKVVRGKISRIEAYDISNIQGQQATGSMITFIKGVPDKNFYRKFKIKISGKPNDIAMTKEVLKRRFKHPEWNYPDLILIDGGKAQLNAAKSALKGNPFPVPVIAIAKKKNELYIENRKKPILLKKLPREVFNLILQLRDEAHRFAIAYHRKRREIDLELKS